MATACKVAATGVPADMWLVQVTSNFGTQRSIGCGAVRQEGKGYKEMNAGLRLCDQSRAVVVDAVCVSTPDEVGSDGMAEVEEMMEKSKTVNLSLHGDLVSERAAHVRALTETIRVQRKRKTIVEEKTEGRKRRRCATVNGREGQRGN